MPEEEFITKVKKKALEEELVSLKGPKRKEILESLEFAKSLGDLSENAEYQQAREEQGKLEERIAKIEYILRTSVIMDSHHSSKVEVGSTIHIQKEGNKEQKKFQIVGSEEADMGSGKISHKSPLGLALLGKKKGETVSFQSPIGIIKYKIIDIE
ncbi:MAG TPA: transcription elongation factor GreA [Candidatus Paceibacterota bacterium]